jgi:flagellum-specific ATP synthase
VSSLTLDLRQRALGAAAPLRIGRVSEILGLHLRVTGLRAAVGDLLEIDGPDHAGPVPVEVAASDSRGLTCLPLGETTGLRAGALARHTGGPLLIPVGADLQGRVLDGLGRPIDGGPALDHLPRARVDNAAPSALSRPRITEQLGLGVRVLDTLVPCGRGQRIGVMAGSGVGKSSLLSMIARGTDAEVSVIALIGERGREVNDFIERDLGPQGLAKSVVVVATGDQPAITRVQAALTATAVAEYFRDTGKNVLLLMDSLTRFAFAQREIGLASGEPPTTRGYPPSAFALLPRLVERAGRAPRGSITAFYSVLVEGDDTNEPVSDTVRGLLDGHIMLSRRLASQAHWPAIDVLESISRLFPDTTPPEQQAAAQSVRELLAAYRDHEDLISIGAYRPGANPAIDAAILMRDQINGFLRQRIDEPSSVESARGELLKLAQQCQAARKPSAPSPPAALKTAAR